MREGSLDAPTRHVIRWQDPDFTDRGKTDRNGTLARFLAPLANWGSRRDNKLTRPLLEQFTDVDRNADLPKYNSRTFVARAKRNPPEVDRNARASGRKAVLYATCFVNYNNPSIGEAARAAVEQLR